MALGCPQPDELPVTLPHVMNEIIRNKGKTDSELLARREYILRAQGIDFVPSSIELAETENILVNAISRENVLKKFIAYIKDGYDCQRRARPLRRGHTVDFGKQRTVHD
jgi:chromosome partitioning protein